MPIVRSSNGRVCQEEALARWIDPDKGILCPADFIPVLENAKLIYKLDLHIVDDVLKKMKAQTEAGLYLVPISVNLSRTDFDSCDIVEEITKRVDDAQIPREKLIVEITESILGEDFEYMKAQIERFQSLGFSVWMDDFGSGYSSVDVLQDISFDHIKFDIKFMQRFDREKSRIMLTELVRMAMALGIKTITEGVETEEQAEFLREIGCNKLQGYHFCKPVSLEQILERYQSGNQIGFEDPAQSDYYDAIGCVNLYDMSVIAGEEYSGESFRKYFETLPICVFEVDENGYSITRCNKSYRNFTERYLDSIHIGQHFENTNINGEGERTFYDSLRQCSANGGRILFEASLPGGSKMRSIISRIATNAVTGVTACAVVILDIEEMVDNQLDFSQVAHALSADYLDLFYVNLDTEKYVEYSPDGANSSLNVQTSGEDFFAASRRDAYKYLYSEDVERFVESFTRENVLKCLDEEGIYRINYRRVIDGVPRYASMKAVRSNEDHLIIGVSDVDAQMKLQKEYDSVKEERRTYSRIMALAGNYIAIYTVDPDTGRYEGYETTKEFDDLNLRITGDDFFTDSLNVSINVIYPGDVDLFKAMFTKEKMLEEIGRNGAFTMIYRLMLGGEPTYVNLRAVITDEDENSKMIVGISYYS